MRLGPNGVYRRHGLRAAAFPVARLDRSGAWPRVAGRHAPRCGLRAARNAPSEGSLGAVSDARGGVMSELLLDAAGRRRSPATCKASTTPRSSTPSTPAAPRWSRSTARWESERDRQREARPRCRSSSKGAVSGGSSRAPQTAGFVGSSGLDLRFCWSSVAATRSATTTASARAGEAGAASCYWRQARRWSTSGRHLPSRLRGYSRLGVTRDISSSDRGRPDRPPPTADFKGLDARRASPGSRRDAPSRPPSVGRVRSPVARSAPLRGSRRSARNRLDRWTVRARPPAA
jgi:hypothetical protein